jgi:transposase
MGSYYIGLDVSMKETFICVLDSKGNVYKEHSIESDPQKIASYIHNLKKPIEKVGLESGGLSHYLVSGLRQFDIPAYCIDARKIKAFLSTRINKTDKNDARGIADVMRCGIYKEVHHKSKESVETNIELTARRLIVDERTKVSNSVRGLLKTFGIRLGNVGRAEFVSRAKDAISDLDSKSQIAFEALLNCYKVLHEQIKSFNQRIKAQVKKDDDLLRLMTIPGVGPITASKFKSTIDDPSRFGKARAVGAFLGLTPKLYSSGEIHHQGRISKYGCSETRSLLVESAMTLLTQSKKWSRLKAWGLKLSRKHGMKKAAVAVARKLAIIMYIILRDKCSFIYGEKKLKELAA